MINLIEKMLTVPMKDYPYSWVGARDYSEGVIAEYCDRSGFALHGPQKKDLVFRTNTESSQAFEVTYSNEKTGRIRVESTNLFIAYNEVLRNHLKKFPSGERAPDKSKIFLVENKK